MPGCDIASGMRLLRAHGLGNDYLVLEAGPALSPALVRALCDRHTGVGGDGVLEPIDAGERASWGVRIWNPDGSVAEKSGNGLRIFARWLHSIRGAPARFTVWTGFDVVTCEVGRDDVTVEMGTARARPLDLTVDGQTFDAVGIDLGNPHCVCFFETSDLDGLPWRAWGRALEVHPTFPQRTNVQFARIVGPRRLEARIWERGAGETRASGSSACAIVAAAVATGRIAVGSAEVVMPGGSLQVDVDGAGRVVLTGPVEGICRVELLPDFVARLDRAVGSG